MTDQVREVVRKMLHARMVALTDRQRMPDRVTMTRDDARVLVQWFEGIQVDPNLNPTKMTNYECDGYLDARDGFMLFGMVLVPTDTETSTFRVSSSLEAAA